VMAMTMQTAVLSADAIGNGSAAETPAALHGAAQSTQCVTFALGNDQYGVDVMTVPEIKGWSEVTYLPGQPDYVRGVLNLRGIMVPIVDLRSRFGQGTTEATPFHIAIIVEIEGRQVGLLADRVLDIVSFGLTQVQPVPHLIQGTRTSFLSGLLTVEGAMIALINLSCLLSASSEDHGPSIERH